MPSLLALPTEIRHKIFDYVFDVDPVLCYLFLTKDPLGEPVIKEVAKNIFEFGPRELYMSVIFPIHSLLLVSHVIRAEALSRFWIVLIVDRWQLVWYDWQNWTDFVIDNDESEPTYGSNTKLGPGAVDDDFRELLRTDMFGLVRRVRLESVLCLDGKTLNRAQFPMLEEVILVGYTEQSAGPSSYNHSWAMNDQTLLCLVEHDMLLHPSVVCKSQEPGRLMAEYWDGVHDVKIASLVKDINDERIVNVGSFQERGYKIFIEVKLVIWCEKPMSPGESTVKGYMDIVVDYDRDCVVRKSSPCVTKFEMSLIEPSAEGFEYNLDVWKVVEPKTWRNYRCVLSPAEQNGW